MRKTLCNKKLGLNLLQLAERSLRIPRIKVQVTMSANFVREYRIHSVSRYNPRIGAWSSSPYLENNMRNIELRTEATDL